jgi:transcription initiation factor TFIIB
MTQIKQINKEIGYCPECTQDTGIFDQKSGDIICRICGLVLQERQVKAMRRRVYTQKQIQKRRHTGDPTMQANFRPRAWILKRDMYNISELKRKKFGRLRRLDCSVNAHIRGLIRASQMLERVAGYLGLSSDLKEAIFLLVKKVKNRDLIRGRGYLEMIGASIHIIALKRGINLDLHSITEACQVSRKKIWTAIKLIVAEFNLSYNENKQDKYKLLVLKACANLNVIGLRDDTLRVIRIMPMPFKSGKKEAGIVAGALWYVQNQFAEYRITQRQLAEELHVTCATIRNKAHTINDYIEKLKAQKEDEREE